MNDERYAHELSLIEVEELRPGIAEYLAEAQRRIAELEDQVKDFTRLAAGQKTVKT